MARIKYPEHQDAAHVVELPMGDGSSVFDVKVQLHGRTVVTFLACDDRAARELAKLINSDRIVGVSA